MPPEKCNPIFITHVIKTIKSPNITENARPANAKNMSAAILLLKLLRNPKFKLPMITPNLSPSGIKENLCSAK